MLIRTINEYEHWCFTLIWYFGFFYVMYYFAIYPRIPFTSTWVHPRIPFTSTWVHPRIPFTSTWVHPRIPFTSTWVHPRIPFTSIWVHPRIPFTRTWVHPYLCLLVNVAHHFSFQNYFVLLVCVLCLVLNDVWVLPSWLSLRFSLTLICLLQLSLSSKI
jgi:hypothetical protein